MPVYKQSHSATIASGASLSGAVLLGPCRLCGVQLPGTWTTAAITFEVSVDGGTTFKPLYDLYGTEYTAQAAADRWVGLPVSDFAAYDAVKIRSGSVASPVNQAADRALVVAAAPLF